jgi:hypothetical protein
VKKFQLIKLFGAAIRQGGAEPKEMSCTELEARISEMLKA